jgi:transposase
VVAVREACPTGDGLYRELLQRGYRREIIAPALIPRRLGGRVSNDRRDCLRMDGLSRAVELEAIRAPDEAHWALRNLCRARERAAGMRLRTRQQLKAFLLRDARRDPGKTARTKTRGRWIAEQHFEHAPDRIAPAQYQLADDPARRESCHRRSAGGSATTSDWRSPASASR